MLILTVTVYNKHGQQPKVDSYHLLDQFWYISLFIDLRWWIGCFLSFLWSAFASLFIHLRLWIYCVLISLILSVLVSFVVKLWLWIYCFISFVWSVLVYIYHFSSSYGREFIVLISYICLISFGIYIYLYHVHNQLFILIFTVYDKLGLQPHLQFWVYPKFDFDVYSLQQSWSTTKWSSELVHCVAPRMFKVLVDLSVQVSVDFRAKCKNGTVNKKHGL